MQLRVIKLLPTFTLDYRLLDLYPNSKFISQINLNFGDYRGTSCLHKGTFGNHKATFVKVMETSGTELRFPGT